MSDNAILERTRETTTDHDDGLGPRPVEHLYGLEIPVSISFGEREIALRDLASLGPGSILELERGATAPVDLLVNGRPVARGELLIIDDQYAVRITQVMSTGERILSLSATDN